MKFFYALLVLTGLLAVTRTSFADTLILKNGDHLTGTIDVSDGKAITFKTDYAGDIQVKLDAIKEITSDKRFYVTASQNATVVGNLALADKGIVVHPSGAPDVNVPFAEITMIRSPEEQQSYEKTLHSGLLQAWNGNVDVGLALARGNSDTTNLSTGFKADRKTQDDEIKLYTSSVYATSGASAATGNPGGLTADAILAGARYDRNITKALFGFGSGDFNHDALQDLDLQSIYSGGLGWHAINNAKTTLDLLGGINYTRETYSGPTAAAAGGVNVNRNLAAITAGENLTRKFGASTVLTANFVFYPDLSDFSQYRFALDAGVVTKLKKWLGWQTTFSDRYVTNPPILGIKSNDVILSTGLNIAFSH